MITDVVLKKTTDEKKLNNDTQTLYNKYRPRNFQDFVGHKDVVKIITNSIKSNYIHHSIILTGIRGVGKTSLSWIFATAINCLSTENNKPCGVCHICQACYTGHCDDIIEVNSANHTGVENMRTIIDDTFFAPKEFKYKVFIFDEAHMLSNASWNSLLKTLEEPPSTVKFVFCTTDVNKHKIPDTILSRSLLLELGKISEKDLLQRLKYITDKENIKITGEAIKNLVSNSSGSLRDALSLLENFHLLMDDQVITLTHIEKHLRIMNSNSILQIYTYCLRGDWCKAVESWKIYYEKGYSSLEFLKKLNVILCQILQAKLLNTEEEAYISLFNEFDLTNNIIIGHWEICLYGIKQLHTGEEQLVSMILIMISIMEENMSFQEMEKIFPGIKRI